MVRALLDGGAAADTRDHEGKTALAFAAYHGHTEAVLALLERGAALDASDGQGKSALQWAAMGGRAAVAREMLTRGADVDATDRRGKTALHHAARQGQAEMVRVLLEGGASFVRSEEGVTPVETAIYNANDDAVALGVLRSMLGSEGSGGEGSASAQGGATAARAAAARAAVVAAHPWTGQTPMHIASYLGRRKLVELLLAHGAAADSAAYIQAGDGLRERDSGPDALAAARDAYAQAGRLEPSSRAAAARLRITATDYAVAGSEGGGGGGSGGGGEGGVATSAPGSAAVPVQAVPTKVAHTVEELSVLVTLGTQTESGSGGGKEEGREAGSEEGGAPGTPPEWARRAVKLWREQGVVVFPSLLNATVVSSLREAAEARLQSEDAVDLSGLIRQSSGNASHRMLRPLPVSPSRGALAALASSLAPFLARALMSPRQLLLDFGAYRTAAGAEAQEWHTDSPFRDSRIAHVQIALVETGAEQGELQVQPATHGSRTPSEKVHEAAGESSSAPSSEHAGVKLSLAPVPAGTVSLYRLDLLHRGGRHSLPQRGARLIGSLKLMGEHAFVPDGIPLKMLPEDAGRWWLEGAGVVDRASTKYS